MKKQEIRQIAMEQSAYDLSASPTDFLQEQNILVPAMAHPKAKKYYHFPLACNMVSYGGNVVAAVEPRLRPVMEEYLEKFTYYHCFETPNLHWLEHRLRKIGQSVCFMAEYFLPDPEKIPDLPCPYQTRLMEATDFAKYYLPSWSNALCEGRKHLDVLGVGAFDGDTLVGLAACSADCANMWQIGVDVLPAYRRMGIASALTSRLALEILERGKVPFYCCAWSNVISARNAIKSGFVPGWVEMTVKPLALVKEMNR